MCVGVFVLGHAVAAAGYGCCGSLEHNLFTYFASCFGRKMTRFILDLSVPRPHGVKAPKGRDKWYKNAHVLDHLFNPLKRYKVQTPARKRLFSSYLTRSLIG